jgi:hypothetical protein
MNGSDERSLTRCWNQGLPLNRQDEERDVHIDWRINGDDESWKLERSSLDCQGNHCYGQNLC